MILLACLSASMSLGQFATNKCSLPRFETSSIARCSTVSATVKFMRPAIAQGLPGDSSKCQGIKTGSKQDRDKQETKGTKDKMRETALSIPASQKREK